MHHNQDIRWMGGLRKYMPITWITSLLGTLALIGTRSSGFYSKDSIIEAVQFSTCRRRPLRDFAVGRCLRDLVLPFRLCTSWSSTAGALDQNPTRTTAIMTTSPRGA